jgi:A/G-specific adenine glycosylase
MARFPTVRALADAPLDDVLAHWAGLGYYSRARNLQRGARSVGDALPDTARALREVPGIGPYTAGAIASIAFGERAPLVDGNVARVYARVFAIELDVKSREGVELLWARAREVMDALAADAAPGDLNQGLMELGATACAPKAPACLTCPLAPLCEARARGLQDVLPKVAAKPSPRLLERTALLVRRRREVLLARRRPEGLYGGLWELPVGEAWRADGPSFTVEQVLTHRRLVVTVVPTRAPTRIGAPRDPGYDALAWHSLDAVLGGDVGVSSLTRTILCSPIPTRSPSSPKATPRSSKASPRSVTTPTTTTSARRPRARRKASTSSSSTTRR